MRIISTTFNAIEPGLNSQRRSYGRIPSCVITRPSDLEIQNYVIVKRALNYLPDYLLGAWAHEFRPSQLRRIQRAIVQPEILKSSSASSEYKEQAEFRAPKAPDAQFPVSWILAPEFETIFPQSADTAQRIT